VPRVLGIELDSDFRAALAAIPGIPGLALTGMMLLDAAFILVSADQDFRGARNSLHVSIDNGIAEHWQYIKWGALALMLVFVAWVKRALIYVIWAVLFVYLLIDDSQQIHETYGLAIADALGFQPAFGLRALDFGELIVTALAAGPLLGTIGLVYLFASRSEERVFTHTMIALLIALAFFGGGRHAGHHGSVAVARHGAGYRGGWRRDDRRHRHGCLHDRLHDSGAAPRARRLLGRRGG